MACYGLLRTEVRRADGALILRSEQPNIITDDGLVHMRGLLGSNVDFMSHMAVGTGATAASSTDSVLDTEVFRNLIARRSPQTTGVVCFQMFIPTSDANGFTLREAGIFNASTAGDMFSRVVLAPAIVKTVAISVTLTWLFTFTEG